MTQGWISLNREIQKHWLWSDKPFSKGQAWVDMLLLANHQDNKFLLGNQLIDIKRGSFITSEIKLMERWEWSKTKVRAFLKLLEDDSMLVKKSDNKKTTLTIVNYDLYQDNQTTEEPQKDFKPTAKEPLKDTNNNVTNVNNDLITNIWAKYPRKKGKKKSTESYIPKLLKTYSEEQLLKAITNYSESEKNKDYLMHGSTFFCSGYLDYLDENYEETKEQNSRRKVADF